MDCLSEPVTLFIREEDGNRIVRSRPAALWPGRMVFGCCADIATGEVLFMVRAHDAGLSAINSGEKTSIEESCSAPILGGVSEIRAIARDPDGERTLHSFMAPTKAAEPELVEIRGLSGPLAEARAAGGLCGVDGDTEHWLEPRPSELYADESTLAGWQSVGRAWIFGVVPVEGEQ